MKHFLIILAFAAALAGCGDAHDDWAPGNGSRARPAPSPVVPDAPGALAPVDPVDPVAPPVDVAPVPPLPECDPIEREGSTTIEYPDCYLGPRPLPWCVNVTAPDGSKYIVTPCRPTKDAQ